MAAPLRILVVEDEPAQQKILGYNLAAEGYDVLAAFDGDTAQSMMADPFPDLVILDWMIPHTSGIELCRQWKTRKDTRDIPIIMLSARGDEADKVRGLETGADDYLQKPYGVRELLARVKSQLKRKGVSAVLDQLAHADITIDLSGHKITRAGSAIAVGPREFDLLVALMEHPGRVWGRDHLLTKVWGADVDGDTRTVDVHISRLRKSLTKEGGPDPIRTVRGAGYALD